MNNIINTGSHPKALYTLCAAEIGNGVIDDTGAAAQADNEQFDGKTTE